MYSVQGSKYTYCLLFAICFYQVIQLQRSWSAPESEGSPVRVRLHPAEAGHHLDQGGPQAQPSCRQHCKGREYIVGSHKINKYHFWYPPPDHFTPFLNCRFYWVSTRGCCLGARGTWWRWHWRTPSTALSAPSTDCSSIRIQVFGCPSIKRTWRGSLGRK